MPSEKTVVVEYLFFQRWNDARKTLTNPIVTLDDIGRALRHFTETQDLKLSALNPANFMKDLIRGQAASKNWPAKLTALGYSAKQTTGGGNAFTFIAFEKDQTEPFPDPYKPRLETSRVKVQTVSLPYVAKQLGRADEAWIIQTAVNLRIVETHFAVQSAHRFREITHLQMSVKLRKTEIDALFLGILDTGNASKALITCEAKQHAERILEDQIIEQVKAAADVVKDQKASAALSEVETIIPIGIRAVKRVGLYLAEFQPVAVAHAAKLDDLVLANSVVYELVPPVPGI